MTTEDLLKKAILEIRDLRRHRRRVAIIGMAVRFPGGATSPDTYWDVFRNGVSGIREIPMDRWDTARYYHSEAGTPGKMYTRYMGSIADVSAFDAAFFNISPREAEELDPQQRILLETTYHALESAGYAGARVDDIGVYIGAMSHDYMPRSESKRDITEYTLIGTSHCMLAGRIAYAFGFTGPAVTLDTACSSSLVALHQACQGIRQDDCAMAIVGGVNLILTPDGFIGACQANMVSGARECHVFSDRSTGYSRGEGCGVVVLKDLDTALADRDPILAIVEGSAVNQDGATQGITAPNVKAQINVMRRCLANARLRPEQISFLEAHGTGTPLGDPIEVQAINAVYSEAVVRSAPLLIGAAKANIGHLESAAGVAGLIKAMLVLRHREAPAILNLDKLNERLRFDATKLTFPRRREALPSSNGVRRAAVSSFGFSGTNAHVILAEAPEGPADDVESSAVIPGLVISGKRGAAIQQLAVDYAAKVARESDLDLRRLCYSSQVHRGHYGYRRWLSARSRDELGAQLQALALQDGQALVPVVPTDELGLRFVELSRSQTDAFRRSLAAYPRLAEIWRRYSELSSVRELLDTPMSGSAASRGEADRRLSAIVNICAYEFLAVAGASCTLLHAPKSQVLAAAHVAGVVDVSRNDGAMLRLVSDACALGKHLGSIELADPTLVLQIDHTPLARARTLVDWLGTGSLQTAIRDRVEVEIVSPVIDLGVVFTEHADDPVLGLLRASYEAGLNIRWRALYRGAELRGCELPQYPFEKKSYSKPRDEGRVPGDQEHALLGRRTLHAAVLSVFSDTWSLAKYPFLGDHRIKGDAVFPAAGYLALVSRAAALAATPSTDTRIDVTIHGMVTLAADQALAVTTTDRAGAIEVFCQAPGESHARSVATAQITRPPLSDVKAPFIPTAVGATQYPVDEFYRRISSGPLSYGKSFRTVRELYREAASVVAKLALPLEAGSANEHVLHPALLDGVLQVTGVLLEDAVAGRLYVPVQLVGTFRSAAASPELWCRVSLVGPIEDAASAEIVARMDLANGDGSFVGTIERAVFRAYPQAELEPALSNDLAFEIAWRQVPLEIVRESAELSGEAHQRAIDACRTSWASQQHAEGLARLDRACARAALAALAALDMPLQRGPAQSEPRNHAAIRPPYHKLLARMRACLEEDGIVAASSGDPESAHSTARALEPVDAELAPALELLERCAPQLPGVMRGEVDPIAVLFPNGVAQGSIYENTLVSRHLNELVASAFGAAVATLPRGADLMVLEVGAGTGSTTAAILPTLAEHRYTYFYTDVSPVFLEFGRTRFEQRDLIFRTYDLEKSPTAQQLPARRFDIIIAANVLHAVSDLGRALDNLRALLKPGGFLILRELTQPLRWLDFTFGLTREWWSSTDFRADTSSPIIALPAWTKLLGDSGFTRVKPVFSGSTVTPENVIVAQYRRDTSALAEVDDPSAKKRVFCSSRSELPSALQGLLRDAYGPRLVLVEHARVAPREISTGHWQGDLFSRAGVTALLRAIGGDSPGELLFFDDIEPSGELTSESAEGSCSAALLSAVQAFASSSMRLPDVTVVTRSIHPEAATRLTPVPLAAQVYGTMKVLAREQPQSACKVVGVADLHEAAPHLLRELVLRIPDSAVMLHGGRRYVPVLKQAELAPPTAAPRLSGTHIVAGGAGGIGRLVVDQLMSLGADRVVVLGRRPPTGDVEMVLSGWRAKWGARVGYFSCDVSDAKALGATIAEATIDAPPIRGMIYSITGLLDRSMVDMSWAEFQAVARPKALGLLNLHRASLELDLEHFLVFSSAVTLFGTQGQANHAAANAFFDAFTEYRKARGLPVVTINWGLWSDTGAVKDRVRLQEIVTDSGIGLIDSELGERLIAVALRQSARRLILMPMNVTRFMRRVSGYDSLLNELHKRRELAAASGAGSLMQTLRSYGVKRRTRALRSIVMGRIRECLKYDDDAALGEDDNLFQLGVDSLVATDIVARINRHLDVELSSAALFTYPTVSKLVEHIIERTT
jgi:acyl transferase domain-containing protein/SAM-dependent methyltransferase/NAD(P)-dependent dehydrogenase (short-subunit alcohol dehydrogenase family)/acyl carrier protein